MAFLLHTWYNLENDDWKKVGCLMEFNEKLQELRKEKGLTQEELAQTLYVSRAAVSKWESGRGYPGIDSLKAIAKYFSVSIDSLLSGEEVLNIAEEDRKNAKARMLGLIYGLLDLSSLLYLFLPFFSMEANGEVATVSLLVLTGMQWYLKAAYSVSLGGLCILGAAGLCTRSDAVRNCSLVWNAAAVMLFIVSPQPYAAALLFAFLGIKVFLLVKER